MPDIQHHVAHVLAAALEHQIQGPLLGFALDGTGLAPDRASIWGFQGILMRPPTDWSPVASLRPFPLPGADAAARRPLQTAYALCRAFNVPFPDDLPLSHATRALLDSLLAAAPSPLAPLCSSAGRLFDAVAALLGLAYVTSSEAIPAMLLQTAAELAYDEFAPDLPPPYPFDLLPDGTLDPSLTIAEIEAISRELGRVLPPVVPRDDIPPPRGGREGESIFNLPPSERGDVAVRRQGGVHAPEIADRRNMNAYSALSDLPADVLPAPAVRLPALRFHVTIAHMIRDAARRHPDFPVTLVGGCFQNSLLLRLTTDLLRADGRTVLSLHVLPPSDASLAPASLLAFQP